MIDLRVIATRIGLALLLGAIVGIEREWRHKNAGIKTNTLVAIGSSVFAMLSNTSGPANHNPGQLAAAVVTGIGFIGAGVIIHRGASVQGVTTAATLWANASMGVAVGLGFYEVAILAAFAVIIVQFGIRTAVQAIARRGPRVREVEIRIECSEGSLTDVNRVWSEFAASKGIASLRHSISRARGHLVWTAAFMATPQRGLDLTTIEEELVSLPGVTRIDARQTTPSIEQT